MKLLIVEDNQKLAMALQEGLVHEGYMVDVMHDGREAFDRLSHGAKDYSVVVLDIMLPGKDGIAVCSELRAMNVTVSIIMLTAKDATADRVAGLDAGADDYLIKPFSFEELVARIRAILRRPQTVLPEVLQSGPFVLDTKNKTLVLDGAPIVLTLREFGILEYLMRHPGQVVTREQLLSQLWDYSFDGFSNVVDVHIKNLRKKIGSYENTIATLRGVGYRFTV